MSNENAPSTDGASKDGWTQLAPALGCGIGGCLVPLILFILCAVFLGDTGGPLFWPFIAIPLGGTGLAWGIIIRLRKRNQK